MVIRERIDYRVNEKNVLPVPLCGETAEQLLGRVDKAAAVRAGVSVPGTVFVRRKDGVLKELPRYYDDMLFTHDGARVERVLEGVDWSRVRYEVRKFTFEGIRRALDNDAKVLSLTSGYVGEDHTGYPSDETAVDEVRAGWLDLVMNKVGCVVKSQQVFNLTEYRFIMVLSDWF
jgi:hypothetical protein